ncbi:PREDICTED: UDP-glucuronosyltransferase 2A3-like [Dinoponera quadriceps]|uniref:UDP-glucuronosyltransferase 2A3-like n=1 Tax=Dinoponera quadriceps TaxID=609295 RepID=A0A6P3XI34_DINQU|nr:PREDICTED: UDP-glucuronosyltransferase 2A3-like [Dinoponera quadriceps]
MTRDISRRRIYLSTVYLLTVVVVVFSSSSVCSAAVYDGDTFVNMTKSSLKILGIFGHFGKSHFDVFKPLMEELARRGHRVTVVSHFPRSEDAKAKEPLPTYKDISIYDPDHGVYLDVVDIHMIKHNILQPAYELMFLSFMADMACKTGLRHPAVREFLRSDEEFDLIIIETFNTDCFLGFVHKFKAPYITISTHQIMPWVNSDMGNEDNPSYIPITLLGLNKPMNFLSRLYNMLSLSIAKVAYNCWFRFRDQSVANEAFGPDLPSLKEIARQTQALLVNTHNSLHGSVPKLPNIVEIGGIHIPTQVKPLPEDIAEFLDNAHQGVLYFNLGSMIKMSTIPREKLDVLLNVLGSIPRKVLLKWENEVLPRKLDNVMVKKWIPQFDVLNHPNVKCYLGHGGLLGLSESIYVGVPMILMPMFGDQFHNVAAAKNRGIAEMVAFNNLDEHSLRLALDKVFNDTSYSENVQRLSKAYRDRPATPLETAVWWTEYIARGNGGPYLHSYGADLAWYQYHHIDVVLVLIIVVALFVYILFRLIKLLSCLLHAVKEVYISATKPTNKWKKEN